MQVDHDPENVSNPRLQRLREIAGVAMLFGAGCDGVASVQVERSSMAVIYEDEQPAALDMPEFRGIYLDLGEFENEENVSGKHIADARLDSLYIEVIEPVGGDLTFAERAEIFVEAPGVERRRIAYQDDFPEGKSRVDFELEGVDLEPYIVAERLTLTAEIEGDPPEEDTLIEGKATLDIGVTLAGVCSQM